MKMRIYEIDADSIEIARSRGMRVNEQLDDLESYFMS